MQRTHESCCSNVILHLSHTAEMHNVFQIVSPITLFDKTAFKPNQEVLYKMHICICACKNWSTWRVNMQCEMHFNFYFVNHKTGQKLAALYKIHISICASISWSACITCRGRHECCCCIVILHICFYAAAMQDVSNCSSNHTIWQNCNNFKPIKQPYIKSIFECACRNGQKHI